jgi:hypothetical protein
LEKKIKSRVAGSFSNFYVMRTKKLSLYGLITKCWSVIKLTQVLSYYLKNDKKRGVMKEYIDEAQ